MAKSHFLKLLSYTVGICLLITVAMWCLPVLKRHIGFALVAIFMFTILSTVNFLVGEKLAKSSNHYLYNNLIVLNFLIKMLISFTVVMCYVKMTDPTDNWYLAVFILIYILFTSFEVLFMTKQAKLDR